VVCPITGQAKGFPFEIAIPAGTPVRGVILADQLKSLDWRRRQIQKAGRIPAAALEQVRKRIAALLGIS
jgi:mRNA interferase MazF